MAKNILVTDGAGYIGSRTVRHLLEEGYRMVVVDNLDNSSDVALKGVEELTGEFGDNISFHKVDLCDKAALEKIFAETKFDAVIHFAGLKAVGESVQKPLLYYNKNLIGTVTLLEVMAAHGCKNLVVSSFATVNGWPNEVPYTEELPLSATNPYGRTKLFIEEICHDIHCSDSEWKITLLRYFYPVGAHPSGHIGEDPRGIPNNLMPFVQEVVVGRQPALTVFGNDYSTKDGTGMASKPLRSEPIALTEKKMDMALDDIIKMSQSTSNKSKKQRRAPNENQKSVNNGPEERALKVQQYMDSRSSVRQGFLASRRSNVQGKQFPLAAETAKKAAIAPIHVGAYNGSGVANFNKKRVGVPSVQRMSPNGHFAAKPQQRQQDEEQQRKSVPKQKPQTLDSRFANVKAERMQVFSHKNNAVQRNGNGGWQRSPWTRRQFGN